MRKTVLFFTLLLLYGCSSTQEIRLPGGYEGYTLLPNGWRLTPAGESIETGELPLNMLLTKNGKHAVISGSGAGEHFISVIDIDNLKEIQKLKIDKTWRGLCFNSDESGLFASGGNNDKVYLYSFSGMKLALKDSFNVAGNDKKVSITGVAFDSGRNLLLAVSKGTNSLYAYNTHKREAIKTLRLGSECYDVITDNSGTYAYVSLWGDSAVVKINLANLEVEKVIRTGGHPCEMVITANDKWLYVTNANNNSTSLIDLEKGEEIEKIMSSIKPDVPYGSTPNSASLNEVETILFIANADNNYLAVFDVSHPGSAKSKGFIPTGWYPTVVRFSDKLNKIIVANGKGMSSAPNPDGPKPGINEEETVSQYIGTLFKGTVSVIGYPEEDEMETYTSQVYANTPYMNEHLDDNVQNVISPVFNNEPSSSIKHVFYIIKENRTYDQVFGDMPEGNGDSSLCLFPEKITPNQHRLAREFTLFDNFYVNAEVSADGHNWTTAAYATDYVEKTWPTYYGGRGGSYDFEGGKEITFPSSGYIWDQVLDKGLGFRNYGEFVNETSKGSGKYYASIDRLNQYTCDFFPGWDLKIPDRERYAQWKKDFDNFVGKDSLPAFQIIRLPNDHTAGTSKGFPTVNSMIADNDYAVGLVIEAISKSKFWNESIIFIVEDDAQNGSDHVDAHRSPLLVIGPHVKRHFTDHTMYSTSSVLKTIELILGLSPMTQFDLSAAPILNSIQDEADYSAYTAVKPDVDMDKLNTADMYGSKRSAEMDLTKEDAIPDIEFNEIIWKSVRGENSKMPVPVRSAYIIVKDEDDDDDD